MCDNVISQISIISMEVLQAVCTHDLNITFMSEIQLFNCFFLEKKKKGREKKTSNFNVTLNPKAVQLFGFGCLVQLLYSEKSTAAF